MKKMGKIHNFSNKILLNSKLLKKMKNKINNFRNKKKKCIITNKQIGILKITNKPKLCIITKKETRKYKIKINNVLHDVQNTSNTHKKIFNQIPSLVKLCIITKKFGIKVTNNSQRNKLK